MNTIKQIKDIKEIILLVSMMLFIIFGVKILWNYFGLPNEERMIEIVKSYMESYGLWTIFVASMIESMILLGWYFPGSLVIFLGVSATTGNPQLAVKTVLTVMLGMLVGYTVNYFLGKYGWYKVAVKFGFKNEIDNIEKRIENKGLIGSFFLYVMPGMGSLLSTAFGVLRFNFLKFFSFTVVMVCFWNTLWGVLVYNFGMSVFKLLTNNFVLIALVVGYIIYLDRSGQLKDIK